MKSRWQSLPLSLSALLEVGIMFLPAIPAYLWVWPNVDGTALTIFQSLTYGYVLAGTLWIGLRRWSLGQLGIRKQGIWLGLVFGLVLVLGRTLVIVSVDWQLASPSFSPLRLAWEFFFYFCLVGITEELLFRGLIYHALDAWRGHRWAIWGSSLGFMLWHIFGQGLLVGAATLLYGVIFALARWRAGGILGLILAHGLIDFTAVLLLPDTDVLGLGRPELKSAPCMLLGLGIIIGIPLYFWKLHPILQHRLKRDLMN